MRGFRPGQPHPALYGISAEAIADWCDVHVTTARRWKRGEEPPATALTVITLRSGGDLGVIDGKWAGWRLTNGLLIAPDQTEFRPADVLAGPFWRRLAQEYQREQRVPRQGDWIEERWVPNKVAGE